MPRRFLAVAPLALSLLVASSAFAAAPRPFIQGSGSTLQLPPDGQLTIMNLCPGPIASGWGISTSFGWKVAQQFVPTATTTPLGVFVPVSDNGSPTFTIQAAIYTDAGGGVPGSLITASTPLSISGAPTYPSATLAKIRFTRQVTLNAGTTYVLLFEAPSGACFVDGNSTGGCTGGAVQTVDGGLTWPPIPSDVCRAVIAP